MVSVEALLAEEDSDEDLNEKYKIKPSIYQQA